MKAAVLGSDHNITIENKDNPRPEEKEVRVKVKRCGVCMTDVYIQNGAFSVSDFLVLGHEFAGVVDDIGPSVTRFQEGDKVAANPIINCGYCSHCQEGNTNFCENATVLGGAGENIIDGGFQEYTIVPEKNLSKLDGSVSFTRGAFAEPLACAIRGVNRVQINPGDDVLLIGAGPMGLLLLQLLKKQGASQIIVSEILEDRREVAKEFGADHVFSPKGVNLPHKVAKVSASGKGVDVAIEAVGSKQTAKVSLQSLRRGGKMLIFGVPPEEAEIPVNIFKTYYKEKDILGSFALTKKDFRQSISLINSGKLNLEKLVTHTMRLEKLNTAIELANEGQGLKKQIKFD